MRTKTSPYARPIVLASPAETMAVVVPAENATMDMHVKVANAYVFRTAKDPVVPMGAEAPAARVKMA